MIGFELVETHSIPEYEKRILLQYELPRLDLPGGEESPSLARRLPDNVGRTGGFMGLPVLGLAFLATVRHLRTDTTFQKFLGINFTEVAGTHLLFTL